MDETYCPFCMKPLAVSDTVCPSCGEDLSGYQALSHHLPSGTILQGRYLVGRFLGEGGFGITYIGRDLTLQRRVAIKEYFPVASALRDTTVSLDVTNRYTSQNEAFNKGMERFLAEARTMARMDKQHAIVSVRDFFQENNTAYIVMEYVEGITLKELAESRGGKVSSKELLPMLEPLFEALEALHDAGLVHRDISPDNIMLENGRARLIDFGCARQGSSGSETMTVILKYDYAPIEQYNNRGQGPWTDVYALCATLYRCLCGKNAPRAVDRIANDQLVPPRSLGADITPAQELAIMRGLILQPDRRTQSVGILRDALYHASDLPQDVADDIDGGVAVQTNLRKGLTVVADQIDQYGVVQYPQQNTGSVPSMHDATYVFEGIPCANNDQLARELAGNWESARRHLYSRNLERHFLNNGDTDLSSKLFEIVTGDLATKDNQDLGLAEAIWLISSNNPILIWKGTEVTLPTLARTFKTASLDTLDCYDEVIASGILSWYLERIADDDSLRAADVLRTIEEVAKTKPTFARYLFLHIFAEGGRSKWSDAEDFESHVQRMLCSPYELYRMADSEPELDDALASLAPCAYDLGVFEQFVRARMAMASEAETPKKVGQILVLLDSVGDGSSAARAFAMQYGPEGAWLWTARNVSLYAHGDEMNHVLDALATEAPGASDDVETIMAHGAKAKPLCGRVFQSMDDTPLPEYLGYDGGGVIKALHVDAIPCAWFYGERVPRGFVRSLFLASSGVAKADWTQVDLLSDSCKKAARSTDGFEQLTTSILQELDSSDESKTSYAPFICSAIVLIGMVFAVVNHGTHEVIVEHVNNALTLFGPPLQSMFSSDVLITLVVLCTVLMFGTELVLSVIEIYATKTVEKQKALCDEIINAGNAEVVGFSNGTSELAGKLGDITWEGPIVSIDTAARVRDTVAGAAKWKRLRERPWYAILWHVTSAFATILAAIVLVGTVARSMRGMMIDYSSNSTQGVNASGVKSAESIAAATGIEGGFLYVMIGIVGVYALQLRSSIRNHPRSGKTWLVLALVTLLIVCLIAGVADLIALSL